MASSTASADRSPSSAPPEIAEEAKWLCPCKPCLLMVRLSSPTSTALGPFRLSRVSALLWKHAAGRSRHCIAANPEQPLWVSLALPSVELPLLFCEPMCDAWTCRLRSSRTKPVNLYSRSGTDLTDRFGSPSVDSVDKCSLRLDRAQSRHTIRIVHRHCRVFQRGRRGATLR